MIHANGLVTKSVWTGAAGSTALWTPSTGKRYRCSRLFLYVTANATLGATGGTLTLSLMDGTTSLDLVWKIYLPGAKLIDSLPGGMQTWNTNLQMGTTGTPAISGGTDTTLNLNLSSALTAGQVGAVAMGWEDI